MYGLNIWIDVNRYTLGNSTVKTDYQQKPKDRDAENSQIFNWGRKEWKTVRYYAREMLIDFKWAIWL